MKKKDDPGTDPADEMVPAQKAAKKAAAKKTAVKKTTAKKAAAKQAPKQAVTAPVASPAPLPPLPLVEGPGITTIAARVDVGYGSTLFIRGSGPGLSWDVGAPMACVSGDVWSIDLVGATRPVYFKFLINDDVWSGGPDYFIEPGAQLEVTPFF